MTTDDISQDSKRQKLCDERLTLEQVNGNNIAKTTLELESNDIPGYSSSQNSEVTAEDDNKKSPVREGAGESPRTSVRQVSSPVTPHSKDIKEVRQAPVPLKDRVKQQMPWTTTAPSDIRVPDYKSKVRIGDATKKKINKLTSKEKNSSASGRNFIGGLKSLMGISPRSDQEESSSSDEKNDAVLSSAFCGVVGCKMPDRNTATGHHCDDCKTPFHPYCCERVFGMPAKNDPNDDVPYLLHRVLQ